jgi:transcriptional regulator with GAF, ATPase, and Fis domain/Tfp pilus assembly protein PilF
VWLAEDSQDAGRPVVVKKLHADIDIDVLSREYDVLRELSHPNVAQVVDFRRDSSDGPYLVEDYVEGVDFLTGVSSVGTTERWRLLVHVLRALEYVHVRGVIHGDITPHNVLVSRSGDGQQATLIDFGLAARTGNGATGQGGTPGYAAPEIYRNQPVSTRSDLYSFGVLAYEVLTGEHPFPGVEPNVRIAGQLSGKVENPSAINSELPTPVDGVLLQLLEVDPEVRFATAREVLSALGGALGLSADEETVETLDSYLRSSRLVGRDSALTNCSKVRAAISGHYKESDACHVLWQYGVQGSGRTRLLNRLAGDARVDGARVVVVNGEREALSGVAAWLRGLGHYAASWVAAPDPISAQEVALQTLLQVVGDVPTLLCIDDIDQASVSMVEFIRVLAAHLEATHAPGLMQSVIPLGVVVTSTEPPPAEIAGRSVVHVESLVPWTVDDLSGWLTQLLPKTESLPADEIRAIHGLTLGIPGHVVSLLRSWSVQGKLHVDRGALVVEGSAWSAAIPETLEELISARESALTTDEVDVLHVVQTLERPVTPQIVASVLDGEDVSAVASHLLRLVELGFAASVTLDDAGESRSYRSASGSERVPPARRREIYAKATRVFMAMGSKGSGADSNMAAVAELAVRAVRSGEERLAAAGYRAALAALKDAPGSTSPVEERRLLSIASELAPKDKRASVTLRLAQVTARHGDHEAARGHLESVLSQSSQHDEIKSRALTALANVHSDCGEHPKALAIVADLKGLPARIVEARALLHMADYERAAQVCKAALEQQPEIAVVAELRVILALVYYYTEPAEAALPQFEAAAIACGQSGDAVGHARAVNGVGLIHHRRGAFDDALTAYQQCYDIAAVSGERQRMALSLMNIGTILHEVGRLPEAIERYREALHAAELCGDSGSAAKATSNLGNVLIDVGVLQEAEWWLDRSSAIAEVQNSQLLMAYNRALRGRIRHMQNDLTAARSELMEAVSNLRERGAIGEAGELFIELGMVARSSRDPDGMEHFATALEQASKNSGADKQAAWGEFLRGEALRFRGEPESATDLLRSALRLADTTNIQKLAWRCEASLGRIFREQGNSMEARARFHSTSERLLGQAGRFEGRLREAFLAVAERASTLEEARMAMSDTGASRTDARDNEERLLRVMEINRRLASEREPQRLLEFILDSAVQLTGAERGFIILKADDDEAEGTFNVRAARNIDQESLRRNRGRVSRSITRDVLESGEPIITVDAGEDARYRHAASVHHLKLRSILCFPLRSQGRVVGAIYLDNRFQASTFSERDLDLIAAFGDQAAVAIENAWLFESNEQTRRELEESHARVDALNAELQSRLDDQAVRLAQVETSLAMQRNQLETRYSYDNIIGASPAMERVFNVLDRVTDTGVPVLVQGESGTGKELVARAIHYNGAQRRNRSFVSVNCAALTETLLESELFGHVKGAFTGADRDRKGLFEVADGGTLFLDEVADMSLGMQAKLLRALQEGEVWPVGARRAIRVDVRIVAACNRDLAGMVESKEFRQDLYFRLNVVKLILPPLRNRGDDILLLSQHFLDAFREKHGREIRMSQGALDLLQRFSWPGNVRELEATLTNACLFCDGDVLAEAHFSHKPELFDDDLVVRNRAPGDVPSRLGDGILDLGDMTLRDLEERAIVAALDRVDGNKVEAARRLGITRQTLYNKLKSYGIEVHRRIRRS